MPMAGMVVLVAGMENLPQQVLVEQERWGKDTMVAGMGDSEMDGRVVAVVVRVPLEPMLSQHQLLEMAASA